MLWTSCDVGFPCCASRGLQHRLASTSWSTQHQASRVVGLPSHTHSGLQHRLATRSLLIIVVGLLRRQASRVRVTWPPAWAGFHVCCIVGSPEGPPCRRASLPHSHLGPRQSSVHRPLHHAEIAAGLARVTDERRRLQRQAQKERDRRSKQREQAFLAATIAFRHEPTAGRTIAEATIAEVRTCHGRGCGHLHARD